MAGRVIERAASGTIRAIEDVRSPQLRNTRDLFVYLPPSYGSSRRRYPVLYMQDGQNLFDVGLAFAEAWHVEHHMDALADQKIETIIVGIPNMGKARCDEYSSFADPRRGGGKADAYLRFILRTIKPRIDRRFRTFTDRAHTGLFGSSMGGLLSLYAFFRHPQAFGYTGAMSPSLWFARDRMFRFIARAPFVAGRIYLDVGTSEPGNAVADVRKLRATLERKGYRADETLMCVEARGAGHNEASWSARFEDAMRFLLTPASDTRHRDGGGALDARVARTTASRA